MSWWVLNKWSGKILKWFWISNQLLCQKIFEIEWSLFISAVFYPLNLGFSYLFLGLSVLFLSSWSTYYHFATPIFCVSGYVASSSPVLLSNPFVFVSDFCGSFWYRSFKNSMSCSFFSFWPKMRISSATFKWSSFSLGM